MVEEWESNTWRDGGRGEEEQKEMKMEIKKKERGGGRDLIKQVEIKEKREVGDRKKEIEVNIATCNID